MFRLPLPGPWQRRTAPHRISLLALWVAPCFIFGCHHVAPLDTTALDSSGMNFTAIQTLKGMDVSNAEAAQIIAAKQAGFSDDDCVTVVRLARSRKEPFQTGDDIAALLRAGVSEPTVMQLAQLNQIGLWSGEAQAMRLAGLSDQIILEEAHRRSEGLSVLSGASLANFKNAGMREATLLQLVRRGIPDDEAPTIIALRRRGWSDAQILSRYPGGR
ncbi:MAG: hypothetical protein WBD87_04245 [Candidatus Acidiferrales bacterium]